MDHTFTQIEVDKDNLDDNDILTVFDDLDSEIQDIEVELVAKEEEEKIGDWGYISELLETFRLMNSSLNQKSVLVHVMDTAIAVIQAERGFLLLRNGNGKMEPVIARDAAKNTISDSEFKVSESFLQKAIETKHIAHIEDTLSNEEYLPTRSIQQLNLRSVLCCPLLADGELIGAIYADSSKPLIGQSKIKKQVFQLFADQAAIAIRNAQLYQKLKGSYDKLENAQDSLIYAEKMAARGKMAARIGHELSNLLMGIYGNLELSITLLSTKKYADPEKIVERLKRVAGLVKGMERFSRGLMANSHLETKFMQCNLNEVVHEFLEFIKPVYKKMKTTFEKDFDKDLPAVNIDKGQIQQVLYNLVKNSIQARADSNISLKTRYVKSEGRVKFSIADTGPGIEKEKLKQIFAPLFTDKAEGHGYGLSICKEIIKKHGGSISVESELGIGTEFTISLPVVPSDFERMPNSLSVNIDVE